MPEDPWAFSEQDIYDFLVVPEPPDSPPPPRPSPPSPLEFTRHNYLYHVFNNQIEQLSRLTDAAHAQDLKSYTQYQRPPPTVGRDIDACRPFQSSAQSPPCQSLGSDVDLDSILQDDLPYTGYHYDPQTLLFHRFDMDDEDYVRNALTSPGLHDEYEDSATDSDPPSNEQTPTSFTHPHNYASPQGLITGWTAEQCAEFFTNLGLGQYADSVIDESIDGAAIIALQHADLKEMGINSIGHRLTILNRVYQVKLKHSVPIEPGHYVPPSADANAPDAHATQDDIARIINQIKLRDERIMAAEAELRAMAEQVYRLQEEQRKVREDFLPVIRMVKNQNQALPTPLDPNGSLFAADSQQQQQTSPRNNQFPPDLVIKPMTSSNGLTRKTSIKKPSYLNQSNKMPSPTVHEGGSLEPSAAAMQASSHLTASMSSNSSSQSPHINQQPSPTSPPFTAPTLNTQIPRAHQPASATIDRDHQQYWPNISDTKTPTTAHPLSMSSRKPLASTTSINTMNQSTLVNSSTGGSSTTPTNATPSGSSSSNDDASGFMKSFRVSMEEPCHKVLPMALKKYKIEDDWRQYSLYIVHGDQERCLSLEERPLILFKQLASEGKKPMFMLRRHAAPAEGFASTRRPATSTNNPDSAGGGSDGGGTGSSLNVSGSGGLGSMGPPGGGQRINSYASTVQLPGGVL